MLSHLIPVFTSKLVARLERLGSWTFDVRRAKTSRPSGAEQSRMWILAVTLNRDTETGFFH
jgi:hypothetical protein